MWGQVSAAGRASACHEQPLREPRVHGMLAAAELRPVGVGEGTATPSVLEVRLKIKAAGFAMRSSITGWKRLIKPCTAQAAASPKAQIVWPSIWRTRRASNLARPRLPPPCVLEASRATPYLATRRALAAGLVSIKLRQSEWPRSSDLAITVTAAVPDTPADVIEVHERLLALVNGQNRHGRPPGITACNWSHP